MTAVLSAVVAVELLAPAATSTALEAVDAPESDVAGPPIVEAPPAVDGDDMPGDSAGPATAPTPAIDQPNPAPDSETPPSNQPNPTAVPPHDGETPPPADEPLEGEPPVFPDAGPPPPVVFPTPEPSEPEPAEPAPTPTPTPDPVDLEVEPPSGPDPVDPPPATPLNPLGDGAPGGLTSNAPGCASNCIVFATLQGNHRNVDLDLSVRTRVDTKHTVWVLPAQPLFQGPVPAWSGQPPFALQGEHRSEWQTTLSGLRPETSYLIILAVTDRAGESNLVTTTLTTPAAAPDDFASNASPCQLGCIDSGKIELGPEHDEARITVRTRDGATAELAVSTIAPAPGADGHLVLVNQVAVIDQDTDATRHWIHVDGLANDMTYHVLATVTDHLGNVQQATGTFVSLAEPPPPPTPEPEPEVEDDEEVFVWFERMHVHENGDAIGWGEIRAEWSVSGDEVVNHVVRRVGDTWRMDYAKVLDGTSIPLGGSYTFAIGSSQMLPSLYIGATERDQGVFFNRTEIGIAPQPMSWLDTLPTCDVYGLTGPAASARCAVFKSTNQGPDHVRFDVLVGFMVR